MPSFKTVSDDYTLTCNDGIGTFTVNANLLVTGNTTFTVPSVTTSAFLTVASNNSGAITDMGILAQKTANTFAGLRFDTGSQSWQVSANVGPTGVGTYADIVTGNVASVAGANTEIQFNQAGAFGATGSLAFDYANNQLILQGTQLLGFANTPSNVSNSVALYSNTVSTGGTGLYFTSSAASGELVSKAKAIVYSIIF